MKKKTKKKSIVKKKEKINPFSYVVKYKQTVPISFEGNNLLKDEIVAIIGKKMLW